MDMTSDVEAPVPATSARCAALRRAISTFAAAA